MSLTNSRQKIEWVDNFFPYLNQLEEPSALSPNARSGPTPHIVVCLSPKLPEELQSLPLFELEQALNPSLYPSINSAACSEWPLSGWFMYCSEAGKLMIHGRIQHFPD
jgi:hypothetical protein